MILYIEIKSFPIVVIFLPGAQCLCFNKNVCLTFSPYLFTYLTFAKLLLERSRKRGIFAMHIENIFANMMYVNCRHEIPQRSQDHVIL